MYMYFYIEIIQGFNGVETFFKQYTAAVDKRYCKN